MVSVRSFIVAGLVQDAVANQVWPWLGLVPAFWRRSAARLARPAPARVAATADGEIVGHAVALAAAWPPGKAARALAVVNRDLSPAAYGWVANEPPPRVPGLTWRSGRLVGLLAVLGLFHPGYGVFRNPADLSLLLIGGRQPELAVAARLLARVVRRMVVACPAEHFRNRLALQILAESGLAVLTPGVAPAAGWEIAVDFRPFPPLVVRGGRQHYARPLFPRPLQLTGRLLPGVGHEHPVWAECQLACLCPPDAPPLPDALSVEAILAAQDLARQAGLTFDLA